MCNHWAFECGTLNALPGNMKIFLTLLLIVTGVFVYMFGIWFDSLVSQVRF